jgi:hypothetical protein
MTERSLLGPALLIGGATLFLAVKIFPRLRVFRYWPHGLLLWAALLLAAEAGV